MLIVACRVPEARGRNLRVNVTTPLEGTVYAGWAVTVKSDAWGPDTATRGEPTRFSASEPELVTVKVREMALSCRSSAPKSVPSGVEGDTSPFVISLPDRPMTPISGGGGGS
jgi:hypothetical protein